MFRNTRAFTIVGICSMTLILVGVFRDKLIYATRPLSRCLVKNTAGAHKEPSKKYKNNLRTLKSKSYQQCQTKHEYYNNKTPHFLTAGLQEKF